jgi:hypothetical protein
MQEAWLISEQHRPARSGAAAFCPSSAAQRVIGATTQLQLT